ncbi:MAG: TAXI family TRAP transporter solute-binding subunit [Rhodospirillaceae bacterium]|nr:TAXI family TRAP transporter solute-binding subunit [Rhodospirillaceae bacterium]
MKVTALAAAGAAALTLAALPAVGPAFAQTYSIGTNPQGSSAYATGAAVAKVAKDVLNLRARVVPQGGPVVTLPLVDKGRLNFSIAVSVVTAFAHKGQAQFKGKPQKNVRVVARLRTLRLGIFAPKDSKIASVADLKGVRLSSGFPKQPIQRVFWSALLNMADLTYKDVKGVPAPNGVRGVDDYMGGKVDAGMFSITSGKMRQAYASRGFKYVSLPDDPASVKKMQAIAPGAVVEKIGPSPAYAGVTGPTNIMAASFIVTANAKVSDDIVYKLVKAMAANKKMMVAAFKGMAGFNPKQMYTDIGVPYHPGAMKYYRETGQAK